MVTARLKPCPPQVWEEIAKFKKDRTKKTQDPPSKNEDGAPGKTQADKTDRLGRRSLRKTKSPEDVARKARFYRAKNLKKKLVLAGLKTRGHMVCGRRKGVGNR